MLLLDLETGERQLAEWEIDEQLPAVRKVLAVRTVSTGDRHSDEHKAVVEDRALVEDRRPLTGNRHSAEDKEPAE